MKKTKIIGICVMLATMLAVIMLCVNGCGNADSPDDTTVSEKTAATGKTEAPSAEITETTGKSSAENIETTGLSQGGNISTGATNTSGGGTIVGHTHQYGPWTTIKEPTCLAMGVQERICTCGTMETRNIDKIEHIIVKDAAKVATCTEPGLTEGSHCSMCGIVIQKQEPILVLGHDYVNGRCSRCGEIFEFETTETTETIKPPIIVTESNGLKFELNDDGKSYSVMGIGTCKDKDIVLPSEYNGKRVTFIEDGAFYGCISVTSIVIPESVTSIGGGAFQGCSSLASIEIPSGVTSIGNGAFYGCISLTSIVIPEGVTSIGINAFYLCKNLMNIKIPLSVTSIGDCAFKGCLSLTSIEIPSSVTSIGECAFQDCHRLTSIEIPSSVTSIGDYAFNGCESLTSITYKGTKAQWNQLEKGIRWNNATGDYTIHCTDGDIKK